MIMELHFIQPLIHYLHAHEHEAGLIAAGIAFFESLAVIGSFIPGSITLGAVGMLIGSATIPAFSTIVYISLGAFIGDFLSYGLGRVCQDRIHTLWPFSRYPNLLIKSRHYCQKHGALSILIGRFTGPMRSFVPMITGMMRMPPAAFVCAALPCAFAWVITFLAPGILLGALSQEIPAALATEFVVAGLLLIAIIWFLLWCVTLCYDKLVNASRHLAKRIHHRLQQHRLTRCLLELIDPQHNHPAHVPTQRLIWLIILAAALTALSVLAIHADNQNNANGAILNFIASLRCSHWQPWMVAITALGKFITVALASGLIMTALIIQRQWRYALHLGAAVAMTITAVIAFKHLLFSPRPDLIQVVAKSSSFPSGHVSITTAIASLLAAFISQRAPTNKRWIAPSIAATIIILVAFSRLYLGKHWPTDVLGGALLGLLVAQLCLLSFDRYKPAKALSLMPFCIICVAAFLLAWPVYGISHFKKIMHNTAPAYHMPVINTRAWWINRVPNKVPLIRHNRFGRADHILNVQWLGQAEQIRRTLVAHGWTDHPAGTEFKATLHRLVSKEALPILPKLYHNQPPSMLFTLDQPAHLVLRLWHYPAVNENAPHNFWLGTVGTWNERSHIFHVHRSPIKYSTAGQLNILVEAIGQQFAWRMYTVTNPTLQMKQLHWDQKILLVKQKHDL